MGIAKDVESNQRFSSGKSQPIATQIVYKTVFDFHLFHALVIVKNCINLVDCVSNFKKYQKHYHKKVVRETEINICLKLID